MSIDVEKNCVIGKDGMMYCWDKGDKCFYVITKKKAEPHEIPDEEMVRLMDLVSSIS